MNRAVWHFLALITPLLIVMPGWAADDTAWNLPAAINDANGHVAFDVDSTWHLIKGKTKDLTGKAWLENPKDFRSVRAEMQLPVESFNTGSESRDERMREVMHAEAYPTVSFSLRNIRGLCAPESIPDKGVCPVTFEGSLTMSNTTKQIEIPATVSRDGRNFVMAGNVDILWPEFGIEDPSMLIARLDHTAKVAFNLTLYHPTEIREAAVKHDCPVGEHDDEH